MSVRPGADSPESGLASRVGRIVLAVCMAVLGLAVGFALVEGAVFVLGTAGIQVTPALAVALSTTLLQGVAFGGVSVAYLRVRGRRLTSIGVRVPDLSGALVAASGYALALIGAISVALIVVLSGLSPARNRASELGAGNPEIFLLLVPVSILLIGPGEELLFRGVVQGSLRERFGPATAVVLATVVFAAAHVTSLSGPFQSRALTVGLLFVPGLVLGAAYEYTDNLVVPALIHGFYNATLFTMAYVSTQV